MNLKETIRAWRKELIENLETMGRFHTERDAKEVMRQLSAFSARAYYMRARLVTSGAVEANNFRTKEVDKFIEAIEIQFKIFSRIASIDEAEWRQAKGL